MASDSVDELSLCVLSQALDEACDCVLINEGGCSADDEAKLARAVVQAYRRSKRRSTESLVVAALIEFYCQPDGTARRPH